MEAHTKKMFIPADTVHGQTVIIPLLYLDFYGRTQAVTLSQLVQASGNIFKLNQHNKLTKLTLFKASRNGGFLFGTKLANI